MSRTFEAISENRLMRMREGQNAGEIVELPSSPEIRFVLVPLTDGEYLHSLKMADLEEAGDNTAGLVLRDRVQKQCILMYAAREMDEWSKRVFSSIDEIRETLDATDVEILYDRYLEMISEISPSLYMMTEEEFENLKALWQGIKWNELSGQQQYAARRLLHLIQGELRQASSSGSLSTLKSTPMTDSPTPAPPASAKQTERVESHSV